MTEFASRAAHKLRQQNSHAMAVLVFIRTSPFRQGNAQYARSTTIPLRRPTSDTLQIVQTALWGLERIYKAGYCYAKAGVMLLDVQAAGECQGELDLEGDPLAEKHHARRKRLMVAMDAVNDRFGRGALQLGAAGIPHGKHRWQMRQERRSPRYTTHWEELLVVG